MMSGGVPVRTSTPCQESPLKPGSTSATVGASGNDSLRLVLETASARSLPPVICGIAAVLASNETSTAPLMTSKMPPFW